MKLPTVKHQLQDKRLVGVGGFINGYGLFFEKIFLEMV